MTKNSWGITAAHRCSLEVRSTQLIARENEGEEGERKEADNVQFMKTALLLRLSAGSVYEGGVGPRNIY